MSIASYIKVNQFSRKGVRTAPVGATQEEHLNLQCPPLVMVCLFQLCFPPVFIRRGCWKEICKGCIPSFVLHTTIKQIWFSISINFVVGLWMALLIGQPQRWKETGWEREGGSDMQQRAPGRDLNRGHCSEDKASVHGTPALPTELIYINLNVIKPSLWTIFAVCSNMPA